MNAQLKGPEMHELHPLCTLFPRLSGAEFAALVDDIRDNGLREPITLVDGLILDGGNRYRACLAAGIAPVFREFSGDNLVTYVLSANLHRRHMTPGQQAAIVASAQNWANANRHGGDRRSAQAASLPLDSVASRAAQSGAGERTQRMADKVAKADPKLAVQVAQGVTTLPSAVETITGKRPGEKTAKPVKPDARDAEIARLREELDASRENARELASMVEASEFAALPDDGAEKQIKRLLNQLRVVESQRDSYMTKCNELIKSVKYWKRRAGEK